MRQLVVIIIFWTPIAAIYVDPFYGVLHYTLSSIIRPEQLMWGNTQAAGRIFLVIQASCFFSWLLNKQKLTPEHTPLPLQMNALWFIGFGMIISSLSATNPDWSWRWTTMFLKTTIFCFVISKAFNTAKKVERYYALSLIWSALLAIWGVQQKLGGNARMEGLGGDQLPDVNTLAAVYVMYLPLAYYSIFSRNRWIKYGVGISTTIIFLIFIMFGGSRGAFVGTSACMFLIFLRTKGTQKIKMVFTLTILGVLLALALSLVGPEGFLDEYLARLATMKADKETGEREGSAASRFTFWKTALFVYANNPQYWIKGVGMFCYAQTYRKHADQLEMFLEPDEFGRMFYGRSDGKPWEVHNTYLDILLGGGVLVFLPWVFIIGYSLIKMHQFPKKYPKIIGGVDLHNYARAIEIGIIGYCVSVTFITLTFNDFFYWLLAMAGAVENIGKAEVNRINSGAEDEWEEEPHVDYLR